MKYSKSVLLEDDLKKTMFKKGVNQCKELLTDIFDLDFSNHDEKITNILEEVENKIFEIWFCLGQRTFFAYFSYAEDDELVQEVLTIEEKSIDDVNINNIPSDYKKAVNYIMDLLESQYELDFTPLDPMETDENIKQVSNQLDKGIMEVIFTHEDHEATFTAIFRFVDSGKSSLKVEQLKKHIIYLD